MLLMPVPFMEENDQTRAREEHLAALRALVGNVYPNKFERSEVVEAGKEDTITAYTREFTESELKKLTEFYKTPVGKKASEKMPQLAFLAGQLGLKKAQAHQAELRQTLDAQQNKPGGGG